MGSLGALLAPSISTDTLIHKLSATVKRKEKKRRDEKKIWFLPANGTL